MFTGGADGGWHAGGRALTGGALAGGRTEQRLGSKLRSGPDRPERQAGWEAICGRGTEQRPRSKLRFGPEWAERGAGLTGGLWGHGRAAAWVQAAVRAWAARSAGRATGGLWGPDWAAAWGLAAARLGCRPGP